MAMLGRRCKTRLRIRNGDDQKHPIIGSEMVAACADYSGVSPFSREVKQNESREMGRVEFDAMKSQAITKNGAAKAALESVQRTQAQQQQCDESKRILFMKSAVLTLTREKNGATLL